MPRSTLKRPRSASEAKPAAMFPIPDSNSRSRCFAVSLFVGRFADMTTS
jgi:hypothetical protein